MTIWCLLPPDLKPSHRICRRTYGNTVGRPPLVWYGTSTTPSIWAPIGGQLAGGKYGYYDGNV
eukprot:scaffold92536_cov17-Prasinocladus_malaysianus.AAC.1